MDGDIAVIRQVGSCRGPKEIVRMGGESIIGILKDVGCRPPTTDGLLLQTEFRVSADPLTHDVGVVVDGSTVPISAESPLNPIVDSGPTWRRVERWPGGGGVEDDGNVESQGPHRHPPRHCKCAERRWPDGPLGIA